MADQTRLIWNSGSVVKQGDHASEFSLILRTEKKEELNGPGLVQLIDKGQGKAEIPVEVVANKVSFRLEKNLPKGVYLVEVEHAGYVFPSSNTVTLTVNENLGDQLTPELVEVLGLTDTVRRLIKEEGQAGVDLEALVRLVPGYNDQAIREELAQVKVRLEELRQSEASSTPYDDSELRGLIRALSEKADQDTVYDDSSLRERILALESRPQESYDDSSLRERLSALEGREDRDTVYRDDEVKGRLRVLEERVQATGPTQTPQRHGPTGYTLDRSTTPWTVWFDNGCGLQFPEYAQTATIYGHGYYRGAGSTIDSWPLPIEVLKASTGAVTVDVFKRTNSTNFRFWSPMTKVLNPIRNEQTYDWANCVGNPEASSGTLNRKTVYARVMYELGIWSDEDVLSLGAVRR